MEERLYEHSNAHHIYNMSSYVMKGGSQGAVEVVIFDNGQVLLILTVVFVELRVLVLALLTTLRLVLVTKSLLICTEQQSFLICTEQSLCSILHQFTLGGGRRVPRRVFVCDPRGVGVRYLLCGLEPVSGTSEPSFPKAGCCKSDFSRYTPRKAEVRGR